MGDLLKLLHSLPPYSFLGLEGKTFENSRVVVLPVPFDSTTSYRAGARDGPHAIITASRQIELYDSELNCEPVEVGIFTLDELEPSRGNIEETLKRVGDGVEELLENKKFPVIFGGEHSITCGALRPFGDAVSVLQLDAHADLRNEFEGSKYDHACVMRRVREKFDAVQVGIRSMSSEEAEYARKEKFKLFSEINSKEILKGLGKKVYVTIDLDVFDPSEMPSVGTPEPGGLCWNEVTSLLREVAKQKEIVGFDVVELCPIHGLIAPDFLAAKLAYKLIGYIFRQ